MEKKKIAISVKNMYVKYRTMKSFSIRSGFKRRKRDEFVALKDISFNIEEGKIVGIVGKNGSGKSTLLRTIAGVFAPDKGKISLHGNGVSLLAIGVGFQGNLSGYENIFLSGLLLGFTEKYIKERVNEIIEFSELGDFIYKPVRTYYSGMYSKLAFSITAVLDTDILLIDEVLSVGDVNFKKKSESKMREIIQDASKTVVIVSHSLGTLRELCDEVIWIDSGEIKEHGDVDTVIDHYLEYMDTISEK